MAPRGAPVHRRRRRGELGHLALPHRRRRAVRGVGGRGFRPPRPDQLARCRVTSAVASPARGRPPNRTRYPRYRPRRRRRSTLCPASPRRAGPATPPALSAGADEPVTLPKATIFIDADEWDARARSLGGSSNTLLAGLAARLAQRVGRVTADGSVDLTMPVNERTAGDTRANAITNVDFTVDPAPAPTDLREIRAAIKQALIRSRKVHNERWQLLPLVPLLPQWLARRLVGLSTGSTTSVVSSNLGEVNPAANRPDGTDADYFVMKSLYQGVTKAIMHRMGGFLVLLSGRVTDTSSSRSFRISRTVPTRTACC